ncbi:restriction endonuclease [Mesorhizobium sp. B2-8-5]|nr:restriction endonuclease [Mesorhizobium sp. B2-8-5]UCI28007.1 restriction endonuclease [Mesorhizobium sp. B2-8-5]
MISDDKFIELITAGINRLTMESAEVQWNVKIDRRQFDVLATIQAGLYHVLIGFEVKHKKRSISVEMMDAFVTKAKDAKVHKAVFVSTSDYQEGAIRVAERHDVDLFKITFPTNDFRLPPITVLAGDGSPPFMVQPEVRDLGETDAHRVVRVTLEYDDGSKTNLPSEPSQMNYYLQKTSVEGGGSLLDVVQPQAAQPIADGTSIIRRVALGRAVISPDTYFVRSGIVAAIEAEIVRIRARVLDADVRVELSAVSAQVSYENVLTGQKFETDLSTLPLGGTSFEAGKFYFLYHPLRYYYVDEVVGDRITLYLVESFQDGELIAAIMETNVKHSVFYIPLTD